MTSVATLRDTTPTTERAEATSADPAAKPQAEVLAELVARVGDDARRDPEGYLGRTVVAEGGE